MTGLIADINKALGRPDAVKKWVAMRIPGGEIDVARRRKQLPNNAVAFLGTSRTLCWSYADAGRNAEAVKNFQEALAVFKTLPKDTDYQAIALVSYRHAVTQAGRPDLAIEMSMPILEALRKRPNASESSIAIELYELGYHLCHAHRDAEAEPHLRESLAIQNRLAPGHWNRVMVKFWLATALFRQKKYAEAEPMLLEAYKEAVERIRQARLWHKRYPADVADRLIELYTVLDKPDEVKKWRAERAKYDAPAEAKGQP
jgi:tetratricopeptide (TPR) repeat protein